MGLLIVLSGPGGVGKTTLAGEIVARDANVGYVKSVTTREPRAGPFKEEQYEYVDDAEFRRLIDDDAFVQWINPPGLEFFGTPRRPIDDALADGRDIVFDYVPEGLINLRRSYPRETVGIFVMAPSVEIMRQRLLARGTDGADEADIRTAMAYRDFGVIDLHDYFLVNDDLEASIATVQAIIAAERLRVARSADAERFRGVAKWPLMRLY